MCFLNMEKIFDQYVAPVPCGRHFRSVESGFFTRGHVVSVLAELDSHRQHEVRPVLLPVLFITFMDSICRGSLGQLVRGLGDLIPALCK